MRSSLIKRLERVSHHLTDCDRARPGLPGNGNGGTLHLAFNPIPSGLGEKVSPPFVKREFLHSKLSVFRESISPPRENSSLPTLSSAKSCERAEPAQCLT